MSEALTVTGFVPENIGEALKLAERLATSGLIPAALKGKPADVLVVLMTGRELGLAPMQALRSINVIQGKAAMSADLMQALAVSRRDVCEYFQMIESTALVATYETRRRGNPNPTRLSYTMEEAKAAGLAANDNYRKNPAAMLRARCKSALCKAEYPDLLAGVYDPEELADVKPMGPIPEVVPQPRLIEAKAEPVIEEPPHPAEAAKPTKPARKPAVPKGRPADSGVSADEALGLDPIPTEVGFVESVIQKPTTTGGSRYRVVLAGGKQFFTFNAKLAQAAQDAMQANGKIEIIYEMGQYGADIKSLVALSEEAA